MKHSSNIALKLFNKSKQYHPFLELCDNNGLLKIDDDLLICLLDLLSFKHVNLPKVGIFQWLSSINILKPHWINPIIFWHLAQNSKSNFYTLPNEVKKEFRIQFLRARENAIITQIQLKEVLSEFNKNNIEVLLIKGPSLALYVYPDSATRPSSDIDFLIHPKQISEARETLKAIGYSCIREKFNHVPNFWDHELFLSKTKCKKKKAIELHWDIHRYSIVRTKNSIESLMNDSEIKYINDYTFRIMNLIDELILRSINLAFVHFRDIRLIWIYDVKLIAQQLVVPDDWIELQRKAVSLKAISAVKLSLNLAAVWTSLEIPKEFKNFEEWPKSNKKDNEIQQIIIQRYKQPKSLIKLLIKNKSSLTERIKFAFFTLFPEKEYLKRYYKSKKTNLSILLYIKRWKKWIQSFKKKNIGVYCTDESMQSNLYKED